MRPYVELLRPLDVRWPFYDFLVGWIERSQVKGIRIWGAVPIGCRRQWRTRYFELLLLLLQLRRRRRLVLSHCHNNHLQALCSLLAPLALSPPEISWSPPFSWHSASHARPRAALVSQVLRLTYVEHGLVPWRTQVRSSLMKVWKLISDKTDWTCQCFWT